MDAWRIDEYDLRVVCGLGVTIETLCPTSRFTSVDLPTLDRPPRTTKPERWSRSAFTKILFNLCQRRARGRLLTLFLAATLTGAELATGDPDSRREAFGMVGTACSDQFIDRLRAISPIG